ncbi:MAG: NYN domain-containing protein [Actinobacteria bacterium]|nr:NYN domain-containing protein [Actinomycetota bacterium]
MANEEERIAIFIDFENLALGAKDRGAKLDAAVIMDALTERGRVVVRRSYADWNLFAEYRQSLSEQRIEMIEIPQSRGMQRKNAADIKLAVDAVELAFQRDFVTTFVIASGDSDFTPLVLKLRELNKRVIGVGVEGSTSQLLPGACDEFLFYESLVASNAPPENGRRERGELQDISRRITRTLAGLQRSSDGQVLSSMIKRAIVRKDPTFNETDYGFRAWGELIANLADRGIISLGPGSAEGDPSVTFPTKGGSEEDSFKALREVVSELTKRDRPPPLSGLKNQIRKRHPNFTEKDFGYGGFLQFVKAAAAKGHVGLEWDEDSEDYHVTAG